MRAIIVAAFVAGSFSAAIADDSPSPKQRAEKFFQALAEKGPGPAFDLLFEGSPITSQKPQAVDAMKRQTEAARCRCTVRSSIQSSLRRRPLASPSSSWSMSKGSNSIPLSGGSGSTSRTIAGISPRCSSTISFRVSQAPRQPTI